MKKVKRSWFERLTCWMGYHETATKLSESLFFPIPTDVIAMSERLVIKYAIVEVMEVRKQCACGAERKEFHHRDVYKIGEFSIERSTVIEEHRKSPEQMVEAMFDEETLEALTEIFRAKYPNIVRHGVKLISLKEGANRIKDLVPIENNAKIHSRISGSYEFLTSLCGYAVNDLNGRFEARDILMASDMKMAS